MRMGCKIISILALAAGLIARGAVEDVVFARCSTEGPDTYFDGTPVADGEVYALVATKRGMRFAGFAADGSLVDSAASDVALAMPVASGGRCPPVLTEVPKSYVDAHQDSVWQLFLLDTRRADGKPAGVGADGRLMRVRGWGETASCVDFGVKAPFMIPMGAAGGDVVAGSGVNADRRAQLPKGAPRPRVTAIRVEGETVTLTVADTVSYLIYDAVGTDGLGEGLADGSSVALKKVDGATGGEVIELRADGAKARFFRVRGGVGDAK